MLPRLASYLLLVQIYHNKSWLLLQDVSPMLVMKENVV